LKKNKNIKLSVPNPCNEDWDSMTPNEQGRHCGKCDKTVIDFSLFTDKQLIEFFANVTGRICGRYNPLQVERELVYIEPKNYFLHKLFLGIALTAGITSSVSANYNYRRLPEQGFKSINEENELQLASGNDTTNYVKGRLLNKETHKAITNAFMTIKELNLEIKTDSSGNFKFFVPKKLQNIEFTIEVMSTVRYEGYEETKLNLFGATYPVTTDIEVSQMIIRAMVGDTIAMPIKQDSIKKNK
jgi:hypothetical protein